MKPISPSDVISLSLRDEHAGRHVPRTGVVSSPAASVLGRVVLWFRWMFSAED